MKNILWIGLILFLCGCNTTPDKKDTIRISLLRGPSTIALAQWFEQAPLINGKSAQIEVVESPEQMQALLIQGKTDIAALPMISAANLYNKGIEYSLAGCPVWGTLYLIGKPDATQLHIFGTGTTPDILTRYYLDRQNKHYDTNYTLGNATEITQGLLSCKVEAAVLGEPFVSMVLAKDTTLHILADLNHLQNDLHGFPQTAILFNSKLREKRQFIDSLLNTSCRYTQQHPDEIIRILESKRLFPAGMLSPSTIDRCKINYLTADESQKEIYSYLQMVLAYEPSSIGGKLPDLNFYHE